MRKINDVLVLVQSDNTDALVDVTESFYDYLKGNKEISIGSFLIGSDGRMYVVLDITARISPPEVIITVEGNLA